MIHFPARKCFHVAKVAVLFLLVIALLTIFEQWRGGKRNAGAMFADPAESEYERQILEDEARIIPGLGEGGVAAHLTGKHKRLGEDSEKKLAMNVYLSDRISYNRSLKDYRNPACSRVVYDAELPSASVILIFHNEPYSVVIRTIWSVIDSVRRDQPWHQHANFIDRNTGKAVSLGYPGQDPRSSFVYLKEIILVDDNSTLPELKGKLSHYVRTRLPPDLIRILRLPDRQGLMSARTVGARAAKGQVLVFLDAHCEANADWLRPLLYRIRQKRDAVLTPLIDVVDQSTFELQAAENFQVGGFTFAGHFTWIPVPEREQKRRGSDIAPTWSPTMAGGLFAINRAYYWELGAYDEQMAGWGGENLEMSFRIWQCGGTLETVPCSRVGHVFRSFHPYGLPAESDTHGINTARMAEVWMDEYAELFYLHRPDLRKNPKIGDITHRKILREKLKCKSFQWYLDNIYQEKFVPVRDVYGYGRFMNPAAGLCLDTLQRESEGSPLGTYPCHSTLQATQYFSLALTGELRDEDKCAILQYARRSKDDANKGQSGRRVLLTSCGGNHKAQKWRYKPSGELVHVESGLCLEAGHESGGVMANPCTSTPTQIWKIDYTEDNNFHNPAFNDPPDKEENLRRLRGQRRISRSLLSFEETPEGNNLEAKLDQKADQEVGKEKVRRHSHKRKHRKRGKKKNRNEKKSKNKFILKLVRSLQNGSEDHLEVDIRCSHRKLHPNNSFVRDLVTILNDNDIKVINNGRVFERNKVTELGREVDPQTKQHKEKKILNKLDVETTPYQDQQVKRVKPKKEKWPQIEPLTEHSDAFGVNVATDASPASDAEEKRIIVEDFVEVKSTPAPQKNNRMKKHKRKRNRTTTSSTLFWEPSKPVERQLRMQQKQPLQLQLQMLQRPKNSRHEEQFKPQSVSSGEKTPLSVEDTPMLASVEKQDKDMFNNEVERDENRNNDNEDWAVGVSRFRRNNTVRDQVRRLRHRYTPKQYDSDVEQFTDEPLKLDNDTESINNVESNPVKVVMKSNLTFNLGDEFFAWKKRTGEDITELLNELSSKKESSPSTPPTPEAEDSSSSGSSDES